MALWSPDGQRFVFQNVASDSVELWIGDAATGHIRHIPGVNLNPIFGHTVQWLGGSSKLLLKLVPPHQGLPPANTPGTAGPDIQETFGGKGQSSTYETRDTLASIYDDSLFAYYGASQLAVLDIGTGVLRPVGVPALYDSVKGAPDGLHVLTAAIQPPYSHAVTYQRFARDIAVLDLVKNASAPIARLPLADRVPVHGVPEGPRDFDWRPTDPATLVWAEAQDHGDWNINVPHRDRLMLLQAPSPPNLLRLHVPYNASMALTGPHSQILPSSVKKMRTVTGAAPVLLTLTTQPIPNASCGIFPAMNAMQTQARLSTTSCPTAPPSCARMVMPST